MRFTLALVAYLALAACAARNLRCEGPLQPINPPALIGDTPHPLSNHPNGVAPAGRPGNRAGEGAGHTECGT